MKKFGLKLFLILRSLLGAFVWFPIVTLLTSSTMIFTSFFSFFDLIKIRIAKVWARAFLWWFSVETQVSGKENLPKGPAVILFTHRSFVDIFVLMDVLDHFVFGAKAELFQIPIFAGAMRRFGAIEVFRDSRGKMAEQYKRSLKIFEKGEHVLLAPEGTRSEGEKLLPFKSGPFIFAIEGKVPLVPVIIRNPEIVWPKNSFFPGLASRKFLVTVQILPAISTAGVSDRHQFKSKVRDVFLENLS